MRSILPALLLLAPALHAAEQSVTEAKKQLNALSLLPIGSELRGVMLPRFDRQQKLAALLKAKGMTLISDDAIAGETVFVEFYNPDQTPRGRIDIKQGAFYQSKNLLESREPVTIRSERFNALGTGLLYSIDQGEGFLIGPVTSWTFKPTQTTSMNTRPSPIKAALLGTAMLGQSLIAAPAVAGDEKSAAPPAPAAAPAAPASEQANATQAANLALAKDLDASTAANAKAKEFLEKTGLTTPSDPSPTDTPAAQPIDFQPGPNDSTIQCDGGMYFNGDEGVFVYLKNVRVNDPRFTLTGANELKIFLGKKPQDPTKKKPDAAPAKDENKDTTDKEPNKGFSKFNEVERIVATGAILVEQKQTDQSKTPAKASGAIFSYNIKEDLATITGGYPWLLSNGICVRAKEPNLIVRMQPKAGRASTDPGPWETIVNVEQLQKKK